MTKRAVFSALFIAITVSLFAITPDNPTTNGPLPPRLRKPLPKVTLRNQDEMNLTNLVVFIRFADDEEISQPFDAINQMFNDSSPNTLSVYNYFDAMSYGKIHYNTVFTNQIHNNIIISYQDYHPRSYFEPYSENNPNGYQPYPVESVCPRETQLLADALHYIDSLHLIDPDINLDGNDDGLIDNVSFIVKGDCGAWASLLWPHMEFFTQDSLNLPYTVSINGKIPYTYNFELEGSGYYFSANVFCHEMCHSLGIPDFYHYYHYPYISPVGQWDVMGNNCLQQLSAILKYKFLDIIQEPIEITEDGTYILNSNSSSDEQNLYYIRSSIDSTQWFTLEYRNNAEFMENVPQSGLIVGRWVDTMDVNNIYRGGDAMFDFHNVAHAYWVFRPGSDIDTVNGDIYNANFSILSERTSFGPSTDPHPYLTDGTPETSFEITDIQEIGTTLSFHVHFLNVGIPDRSGSALRIYPNPATDILHIEGDDLQEIAIYDISGKILFQETDLAQLLNVSTLPAGIYFVKANTAKGTAVQKFVKQ